MHPDKKVGLALGILLIGITGAFFFRNDAPAPAQDTLTLTDPESLDRKASQKPGAPYFPEPTVHEIDGCSDLTGVHESSASEVIPGLPEVGPTGYQRMLAEPISVARDAGGTVQFTDRMAPLPTPGRDLDSLELVPGRNAEARQSGSSSGQAGSADSGRITGVKSTGSDQAGDASAESEPDFITHEVVAGDNLSRLAQKYLGSHSKYLTLFEANRDVLATPDDLSLGMKLKIPRPSSANNASSRKSSAASSATRDAGSQSASLKDRKTSPFVQPDRSAVIALGGARRSKRGLSQAPPPNLPRVEGLDPSGDPAIIASRPE